MCEHGSQRCRCRDCLGSWLCEYGFHREQCRHCPHNHCQHNWFAATCLQCMGVDLSAVQHDETLLACLKLVMLACLDMELHCSWQSSRSK